MKNAATANVFTDIGRTPANRPNPKHIHIRTARTTDGSRPTTKAKAHNAIVTIAHLNHSKRFLKKRPNTPFSKNQTIPICIPDKARTCEIPAAEYASRVLLSKPPLYPSVKAANTGNCCSPIPHCRYFFNKHSRNNKASCFQVLLDTAFSFRQSSAGT